MKQIFNYFIEMNFVNDVFLQQILKQGFNMQKPQNLIDMLSVMLFKQSESYTFVNINEICLVKLGLFRRAAPHIVEEFLIYYNNNNGFGNMASDDCYAILAIAFRIESIIMSTRSKNSSVTNVTYISTDKKLKDMINIPALSTYRFSFVDILCDDMTTLRPFSIYLCNIFKSFLTQNDNITNDPAYRFTAYSMKAIEEIICGIFIISIEYKSNLFSQFLESYGSEIFKNSQNDEFAQNDGYMSDNSICRWKILQYIPRKFIMSNDMQQKLPIIMTQARHFSFEVLELLTLTNTETEQRDLVTKLITTALCLYNFTNLKEKVLKVLKSLTVDYDKKERFLI